MYVVFDNEGYVTTYVLQGKIIGGEEITAPNDLQLFMQNFSAYRKDGNELVFDAAKSAECEREKLKAELRNSRIKECFPVINRGSFWHEALSAEQVSELRQWYQAWLDVTDTLIIPEKPVWLK